MGSGTVTATDPARGSVSSPIPFTVGFFCLVCKKKISTWRAYGHRNPVGYLLTQPPASGDPDSPLPPDQRPPSSSLSHISPSSSTRHLARPHASPAPDALARGGGLSRCVLEPTAPRGGRWRTDLVCVCSPRRLGGRRHLHGVQDVLPERRHQKVRSVQDRVPAVYLGRRLYVLVLHARRQRQVPGRHDLLSAYVAFGAFVA
jgi:hypothetical protein